MRNGQFFFDTLIFIEFGCNFDFSMQKTVFCIRQSGSENKKVSGGVISGAFGAGGRSECTGGGHIRMGGVSEKCFWEIFFKVFGPIRGGAVFDDFRVVGRSVGRSGGRSVPPPPPPPSPQKKCGVILHLVCVSLV